MNRPAGIASGVTASYFRQAQHAYDYYWDRDTVQEQLGKKMTAIR